MALMVLDERELERGDGAWENIQEVLRLAFLAHERRLHDQHERVEELGGKCARGEELATKCRGLEGHVDALAKVLNAMSEELKQRAQEEEERRRQHAALVEAVTTAMETQLQSVFARLGSMEEATGKVIRRMELMEEELGHVVEAVDRKADAEVLKTHTHKMEEALKQRCRKVAFDKEVMKVHQLLRSQQAALTDRFQLLKRDLEDQVKEIIDTTKATDTVVKEEHTCALEGLIGQQGERLVTLREDVDKNMKLLREEMESKLTALKESTLVESAEQSARTQNETLLQVAGTIRQHTEHVMKRVEAIDRGLEITALKGEIIKQQEIHEGLSHQLVTTRKDLERMREVQSREVEERQQSTKEVRSDLTRLNDALDDLNTQQTQLNTLLEQLQQAQRSTEESLAERLGDVGKQQLELATELRDAMKAKEKKTRHQMHLVADKLGEMDQIMKLVGKQLVQNTSQLQLLWTEQHELIGDSNATEAPKLLTSPSADGNSVDNETQELEEAVSTSDQHRQLQETIEAKLRDYSNVLAPQQERSPT